MNYQNFVESAMNPEIITECVEECLIPFHRFSEIEKILMFVVPILNSINFELNKVQAIIIVKSKTSEECEAIERTISSLTKFFEPSCNILHLRNKPIRHGPTPTGHIIIGNPRFIINLFSTQGQNIDLGHLEWAVFSNLDCFNNFEYEIAAYLPPDIRIIHTSFSNARVEKLEKKLRGDPDQLPDENEEMIVLKKSKKRKNKNKKNNFLKGVQQVQQPKIKKGHSAELEDKSKNMNKKKNKLKKNKKNNVLKRVQVQQPKVETFQDFELKIKNEPFDDCKTEPIIDVGSIKAEPI